MSDPSGPTGPTPLPPPPAGGPGTMPPPIAPSGGMSTAGLLRQITGVAGLGILFGLATVIVPVVFGWVFYVLPIAGFLAGVEAVRRGQLIGGILAIVLNAIGAMLTLIGVFG